VILHDFIQSQLKPRYNFEQQQAHPITFSVFSACIAAKVE